MVRSLAIVTTQLNTMHRGDTICFSRALFNLPYEVTDPVNKLKHSAVMIVSIEGKLLSNSAAVSCLNRLLSVSSYQVCGLISSAPIQPHRKDVNVVLPHRDPLLCAVTGLALLMFWQYDHPQSSLFKRTEMAWKLEKDLKSGGKGQGKGKEKGRAMSVAGEMDETNEDVRDGKDVEVGEGDRKWDWFSPEGLREVRSPFESFVRSNG